MAPELAYGNRAQAEQSPTRGQDTAPPRALRGPKENLGGCAHTQGWWTVPSLMRSPEDQMGVSMGGRSGLPSQLSPHLLIFEGAQGCKEAK